MLFFSTPLGKQPQFIYCIEQKCWQDKSLAKLYKMLFSKKSLANLDYEEALLIYCYNTTMWHGVSYTKASGANLILWQN